MKNRLTQKDVMPLIQQFSTPQVGERAVKFYELGLMAFISELEDLVLRKQEQRSQPKEG